MGRRRPSTCFQALLFTICISQDSERAAMENGMSDWFPSRTTCEEMPRAALPTKAAYFCCASSDRRPCVAYVDCRASTAATTDPNSAASLCASSSSSSSYEGDHSRCASASVFSLRRVRADGPASARGRPGPGPPGAVCFLRCEKRPRDCLFLVGLG